MTYGYPIDEDEQISPLRRALMRARYPMDERTPQGQSVDDLIDVAQRGNPISSAGGQGGPLSGGVLTPIPTDISQGRVEPISTDISGGRVTPLGQSNVRDVLLRKSAPPAPQNPIPQAASQADALPQQPAQQPNFPQTRRRIADPITYDEDYLRELETKKDPFWKRLAAAAIRGTQAATHQDIAPQGLTEHERDLLKVQGRLGRDVTLAKAQQQLESGRMVPFQLPDGTWTEVPARQAATIASRQQGQQATLSIRRQQMEAHNKRWDTMGKHEAAQDAQRLYNSGAADDNEDLRDEIAARMGLPEGTHLPPHTQGQIRVDDQGNYVLVNPRTGATTPVTQGEQPTGSMQKTVEQQRNRRFNVAQTNMNQRAANVQAGADRRAGMRGVGAQGGVKVDPATRKYALDLVKQVNDANDDIASFDKGQRGDIPLPPEAAARRAQLVERAKRVVQRLQVSGAGYEAGQDERGYPYAKVAGQQGGGGEDPKVRAYANKFFGGDYNAAQAAIKQQRGQ